MLWIFAAGATAGAAWSWKGRGFRLGEIADLLQLVQLQGDFAGKRGSAAFSAPARWAGVRVSSATRTARPRNAILERAAA